MVEVTILPRTGLVSARTDASEPTGDYSTWSALSMGLLVAGLAGAAMLVAADLSTLVEVNVLTVVKERLSGHGQHAWAMAVLGVAAPCRWPGAPPTGGRARRCSGWSRWAPSRCSSR